MRIRDSQTGVAATEFALIAPVVVVLLLGFLEFAWVQSARSALESATMRAARQIAATDCPALRETQMLQTIRDGMQHVPSSDGAVPTVSTKSYKSAFGDIGEPEPFVDAPPKNERFDAGETYTDVNGNSQWDADMGKSGSVGGAGEIVTYETTFRVKSMIPYIATQFGSPTGDYQIRASTVIRNEPIFRTTGCPA